MGRNFRRQLMADNFRRQLMADNFRHRSDNVFWLALVVLLAEEVVEEVLEDLVEEVEEVLMTKLSGPCRNPGGADSSQNSKKD